MMVFSMAGISAPSAVRAERIMSPLAPPTLSNRMYFFMSLAYKERGGGFNGKSAILLFAERWAWDKIRTKQWGLV